MHAPTADGLPAAVWALDIIDAGAPHDPSRGLGHLQARCFRAIERWARAAVADGAPVDDVVAEALARIKRSPLPPGPVATAGDP